MSIAARCRTYRVGLNGRELAQMAHISGQYRILQSGLSARRNRLSRCLDGILHTILPGLAVAMEGLRQTCGLVIHPNR